MMKFQTSVDIAPSARQIGYGDKILLLGSCFADNIGEKFCEHYFQTTINPFGILYNPVSIMKAIQQSLRPDSKRNILQHNGLWHSMMHHGSFSHPDKTELLRRCEESQKVMCNALNESSTIVVTFGTSWIYEMDGLVVANCHKMPADRFRRDCMSADQIIQMWLPLLVQIPNKNWIFTVSPIRHIKDGLHANHLSKYILMQAIDTLIVNARELNPTSNYSYFPSYEIMMDELRDYRFYAEDMVHPSNVAVEYIWKRFVDTYMNAETQSEMHVLHQLWRDRNHRFLHPDSEEAKRFEQRTMQKLLELQQYYAWLK